MTYRPRGMPPQPSLDQRRILIARAFKLADAHARALFECECPRYHSLHAPKNRRFLRILPAPEDQDTGMKDALAHLRARNMLRTITIGTGKERHQVHRVVRSDQPVPQ